MPYSYGMDRFARALAAIPADSDTHTWILASSDFNRSQVHAANFDDADGHIKCTGQFVWDHEVTGLTVAATRPWIAAAAGTNTIHVYDGEAVVPHDSDDHAAAAAAADMATTLPAVGQLQCSDASAAFSSVAWQVQESDISHAACAAAAPDGAVAVWAAMPEAGGVASAAPLDGPRAGPDAWAVGRAAPCAGIAWDPFGALRGVAATPAGLLTWDARAGKTQATAAAAAAGSCSCSCVSYNPSKAHMLITGDAQGRLRLFDDRKFDEPVQTLLCSSAALSGVAFNPAHDQLVLASSADTTTQLWRLSTQSSAPMLSDEGGKVAADGLIACDIDSRDCSVMGVAWSGSSPWCYASLTYDGRLAMSTVPDKEKYRIML